VSKHATELAHSCATVAQLKDSEGRVMARLAGIGRDVEERISDAASLVGKATLQQSHGNFEALRDRVAGSVSALEEQVAALRSDAGHAQQIACRVDAVEASVAARAGRVELRLVAVGDAVEEMQAKVLGEIRERSAARADEAQHEREAVTKLSARVQGTDSRVADLLKRSKKLAASMDGEVSRLKEASAATAAAVFGSADAATERSHGLSVLARLDKLSRSLDAKVSAGAIDNVKQLSLRVRSRHQFERFASCANSVSWAVSVVETSQANSACAADARALGRAVQPGRAPCHGRRGTLAARARRAAVRCGGHGRQVSCLGGRAAGPR
jgi:hypothetical protein